MPAPKEFIDDLKRQLAAAGPKRVLAIVGAGVSIGATGGAVCASWAGLLRDGVERCAAVGHPKPPRGWRERQLRALKHGDTDEWLGVAEQVEKRLRGAQYGRWLRERIEPLGKAIVDRSVLEALRDLGIPVATTNYDDVLATGLGQPAVTWLEGNRAIRVLRGEDEGILHLHGYWRDPDSVVLGIRSYERVLGDASAQAIQQAIAFNHTILFIGFGRGLDDPNFGNFREWMREALSRAEHNHYRLCLESEAREIEKDRREGEQLFALPYGAEHKDLPAFLRSLVPARPAAGGTATAPAASAGPSAPGPALARLPPRPRCLGRDALVEDVVRTLLDSEPAPTPVLGPPGIGKSTVALAALHDPRVAARYGERRWFVRLDSAQTAADIFAEIATTLGMTPAGDARAAVMAALAQQVPAVLALDNCETPWEGQILETEEALAAFASIPGLALIATIRGQSRPAGPAWRDSITVTPLPDMPARDLFLAIAGRRFAGDPHLADFLVALDGVPLAITLLAHAAEAEQDLSTLWRRWSTERTALLKRGTADNRLLNLSASLELSIGGGRITDAARRLLTLLGLLPDGIAHGDLDALLPGGGGRCRGIDASAGRARFRRARTAAHPCAGARALQRCAQAAQ
jgi:hypothetical protein